MIGTTYHEEHKKADNTVSVYHTRKYICYHQSRKQNECDGQAAYRADIVEEKVISTIKELFGKIKTTLEQKILEHKFQQQLAECKTKKKQLEKQTK